MATGLIAKAKREGRGESGACAGAADGGWLGSPAPCWSTEASGLSSCAVVGQSNSIIQGGFVDQLRRAGSLSFERMGRIGASPSILAPFFMTDEFLRGCDYCLLDFCVVDAAGIDDGSYSTRQSLLWAEWACHQARRHGCEPILVIIPRAHESGGGSALVQRYREMAGRLGCYFLDAGEVAGRLLGAGGGVLRSDAAPLYLDAAHPGEALSRAMAAILERFMLERRRERRREVVRAEVRRVERLSVAELAAGATVILRPDSLLSFRGVDVIRGEALRLRTGAFGGLIGVLVNAAACTHDGVFAGSRRVVKRLTLRPYSRTEFEARLVPFGVRLGDGDGWLGVSASGPGERWEDDTMQAVPGGIMPYRVEIADLLVDRGAETAGYEVGWRWGWRGWICSGCFEVGVLGISGGGGGVRPALVCDVAW